LEVKVLTTVAAERMKFWLKGKRCTYRDEIKITKKVPAGDWREKCPLDYT